MRYTVVRKIMSKFVNVPSAVHGNVRGMTVLDREAFAGDVTVPCVYIAKIEGEKHRQLIDRLTKFLLKMPGFKPIFSEGEQEGQQTIILSEKLLAEKKENLKSLLNEFEGYCTTDERKIRVTYENWSANDVFAAVLPENDANDEQKAGGFSQMGHLLHVNLKDEHQPFKKFIGQVLLDKVKNCRTVVNKVDIIENQFRNLSFELLAGEPDYVCRVKQSNCAFEFDFSRVFWNSRLENEHNRLVSLFDCQNVIYDVCAGVGPFAIPAAKRGCTVLANDLNPACVEYLERNAKINKVELAGVHCSDASEFITKIAAPDLLRRVIETRSEKEDGIIVTAAHFIMNLPAMAVEFLPNFVGLLRRASLETGLDLCSSGKKKQKLDGGDTRDTAFDLPPIFVHCYCFVKGVSKVPADTYKPDALALAQKQLDKWRLADARVHYVRNVAPNKYMFCVTFRADENLVFSDDFKGSV